MISTYIVDFYCVEARLVVEVDGSSHEGKEEYDEHRQSTLEALGLKVLRVANEEVMIDMPTVLKRIVEASGEA